MGMRKLSDQMRNVLGLAANRDLLFAGAMSSRNASIGRGLTIQSLYRHGLLVRRGRRTLITEAGYIALRTGRYAP